MFEPSPWLHLAYIVVIALFARRLPDNQMPSKNRRFEEPEPRNYP